MMEARYPLPMSLKVPTALEEQQAGYHIVVDVADVVREAASNWIFRLISQRIEDLPID